MTFILGSESVVAYTCFLLTFRNLDSVQIGSVGRKATREEHASTGPYTPTHAPVRGAPACTRDALCPHALSARRVALLACMHSRGTLRLCNVPLHFGSEARLARRGTLRNCGPARITAPAKSTLFQQPRLATLDPCHPSPAQKSTTLNPKLLIILLYFSKCPRTI